MRAAAGVSLRLPSKRDLDQSPSSFLSSCNDGRYDRRSASSNASADHPLADRFEQIVIPLLKSLGDKYNVSPVPDIVSLAPGFWGILRLSIDEQMNRDKSILSGNMSIAAAYEHFDTWNNMSPDQRDWMEGRIEAVIRNIGKAWAGAAKKPPRILWRASLRCSPPARVAYADHRLSPPY